jgi:acyl dehydratase
VTPERIAAFAAALGDPNPAYRGADPIAPPTFAMVVAAQTWDQLFGDPNLDLQLKRTMHTEQRFTFNRPIVAGDILQAALSISSVRIRGAAEFIGISAALTDAAGEVVCTADSTLLHNRSEADSENKSMVEEQQPVRQNVVSDLEPLQPMMWDELSAGQVLGTLNIPVTRTRLVEYAGASGDFNPIHHSDFAAHQLGLPGVIAHGMWTMGAALRPVTDTFGPANVASVQTRFVKPVPVPDDGRGSIIETTASVSALDETTAQIAIEVQCRGVKVLGATKASVHNAG